MPDPLDHLIDIQITKGHCIVFLDYCQSFIHLLTINMRKYLNQVPFRINGCGETGLFEVEEEECLFQNSGKLSLMKPEKTKLY